MLKKITLFFAVLLLIGGCKKYEDDPVSSRLLTVKLRLARGSWEHANVYNYITGHIYSTSKPSYFTGFSRNGECSSEAYYLFDCTQWELFEHKNNIRFTYRNGQQIDFKITSLTMKNFDFENDSIKISLTRK